MFARFCQAAAVPAALNKRSRLALRKLSQANCVRLIRTEIFRSFSEMCLCLLLVSRNDCDESFAHEKFTGFQRKSRAVVLDSMARRVTFLMRDSLMERICARWPCTSWTGFGTLLRLARLCDAERLWADTAGGPRSYRPITAVQQAQPLASPSRLPSDVSQAHSHLAAAGTRAGQCRALFGRSFRTYGTPARGHPEYGRSGRCACDGGLQLAQR